MILSFQRNKREASVVRKRDGASLLEKHKHLKRIDI